MTVATITIVNTMVNFDWSPLWLSLKTGAAATVIAFFAGICFARLSMNLKKTGRAILDGFFTLPLVLPPTASGFLLLMLFSMRIEAEKLQIYFEMRPVDSWIGCLVAATVIAFPLMYRSIRIAFEQIDENLLYAGRTLGMSRRRIFWKVIIPLSRGGILSGAVLTFVRAVGEYGATAILVSNTLGRTRTISLAIATGVNSADYNLSWCWAILTLVVALVLLILFNIISGRGMKARRWI